MEFLIIIALVFIIAFIFWAFIFILFPFLTGAPYEITTNEKMKKMIKLAKIKTGDKVAELGSGNGKLVIEFAKLGAEVHGYEINPFLVLLSRWKIRRAGLQNQAFIHWKNFWREDLGKFDVILTFQIGYIMGFIKNKLEREARRKIRVVSNNWKLPNLKPIKEENKIYYYEINK